MEMERRRTRSPMAAGSLSTSSWISWGLKALRKAWAGGGGGRGGGAVVVVVEEEEEDVPEEEEAEEERVLLLMLRPVEERRWCCCWCWCWLEGRKGGEVGAGRRGRVVWEGGLRLTWETRAASCCASSGGRAGREVEMEEVVVGMGVVLLSVVMVVLSFGLAPLCLVSRERE